MLTVVAIEVSNFCDIDAAKIFGCGLPGVTKEGVAAAQFRGTIAANSPILMVDIWSSSKRSEVMSLIRSSGNKSTEQRLISIFRTNKITGWRRRQKIFGNPDFVFRAQRLCVFVDGCFWHECPKCYRRPATNQAYWDAKVQRNKERDKEVNNELRRLGWKVIRIWEHQLSEKNCMRLLMRLRRYLQ